MTNFWMLQALDGSNRVDLYTVTTDDTIKLDLESEPTGGSLISFARLFNLRSVSTEETNHFDQAFGALIYYCDSKGYSRIDSRFVQVDSVPDGLEPHGLGGKSKESYHRSAIFVYEHRAKQ